MKSPDADIEDLEAASETAPTVKPVRLLALIGLLASAWVFGGWSLFVVIVAVLVIIFVHELGHFITARRAGMKVTEFFFGFGPRIVSFRRGEVEYGVKAIPAGAYVRIIGMMSVDEVPSGDEPRTYRQQKYGSRVLVASAGVLTHVLTAFVLIWVILVFHGRDDPDRWTIREVSPGSAAAAVGAQPGDRLVSLAGQPILTFDDMTDVAEQHQEERVDVVLERDGVEQTAAATLLAKAAVYGTVGEDLNVASSGDEVRLISVRDRSRAAEAGLTGGERVVELNGVAVTDLASFERGVEAADGGRLDLGVVTDDGAQRSAVVDLGRKVKLSDSKGFFGVGQQPVADKMGPLEAVPASGAQMARLTGQLGAGLGKVFSLSGLTHMFERTTTAPSNAGPDESQSASQTLDDQSDRVSSIVGAVGIGSGLFQDGWVSAFSFLVFLSLTLGLVNLIPLLPFDGGHIVVATYEKIRELASRSQERYMVDANKLVPIAVAVVAAFAILGLMAMYLDITQPVRV